MKADLKEKVMLALLITMAFAIVLRCHSRKRFDAKTSGILVMKYAMSGQPIKTNISITYVC